VSDQDATQEVIARLEWEMTCTPTGAGSGDLLLATEAAASSTGRCTPGAADP
jgi:hypothetical protein